MRLPVILEVKCIVDSRKASVGARTLAAVVRALGIWTLVPLVSNKLFSVYALVEHALDDMLYQTSLTPRSMPYNRVRASRTACSWVTQTQMGR